MESTPFKQAIEPHLPITTIADDSMGQEEDSATSSNGSRRKNSVKEASLSYRHKIDQAGALQTCFEKIND
jgi:hypothetical protein